MEYLNVDEILPNPFQPRKEFKIEELGELAKSIKEYGVLEPLIVRINDSNQFELIAGERRLRAAKLVGLKQVPVILKDYDDRKTAQIALIENLQRSDLNSMEEARAYKVLVDKFKMTQEAVARKVGKSRSYVANFMRLLNLSAAVQELLIQNKLNMGQAKPLLALGDEEMQLKAAKLIIEKELSARKAEALVKKLLTDENALAELTTKTQENQDVYMNDAAERLKQVLGTNVSIKQGKKKSCIEIEFYSEEDLHRLLELMLEGQRRSRQPGRKIIDFNV